MPNLVLEKGGQTYRFGLNTDKSVTNGKAVPVIYLRELLRAIWKRCNTVKNRSERPDVLYPI